VKLHPGSYNAFEYPEEDPVQEIADPSREEALDAFRGVIHMLLASKTPKAAWNRLHVLAWDMKMLPEIHSQRDLARKLKISDGQITNLKEERAAMWRKRRAAGQSAK
jgi:hypothetical protein